MKPVAMTLIAALALTGTFALAKPGVEDPTVKARMDVMGVIAGTTKTLGDMASGRTNYDAAAATGAQAALAAAAADIAPKFEPQATDPVSEAKPEIWSNWEDFVAKADALAQASAALDASSLDGVKAGMGAVGGTCRACHSEYRM